MKIICTAKIANTTVGHIDHAMGYAAGLQRLGHEVYLMERVGSNRCVDANGRRIPFEKWDGRRRFESVAKTYGLWPRCCLIYKKGEATHGMPFAAAVKTAKTCDALMTRSGQISQVPDVFDNAQSRVYLDGNPGHTQVQLDRQGDAFEALGRYDHLFTMGLNIGAERCPVPTGNRHWRPILRPVVLPMWPAAPPTSPRQRFTTISSWQGRSTFAWGGTSVGEKSDNWRQFIDLPQRSEQAFEIALRMAPAARQTDGRRFWQKGWRLSDPAMLQTFDDYRRFISQSRAEFSVAHNRYVELATGWFSDRSALYLASGRPVLVQSTGIEHHLPTGKGLLTFTTLEEAAAGVESINRDYAAHCRAARELAEAYFDADKVLSKLLEEIGSSSPKWASTRVVES